MRIVMFGLAITSSWGNGHATTFRALCAALRERGHDILFYERDVEWYASNRDLPEPTFCRVRLYDDWQAILPEVRHELSHADVAVVGSYFPDGIAAIDEMLQSAAPAKCFYDIDTPITMAELRERGETAYVRGSQLKGLDLYFSFTGGPLLSELEQNFGVLRAVPLYCSFDPAKYGRVGLDPRFQCAMSYMGTYAPDRQPKIEELLSVPARAVPDERFIVAGPLYPREVRWPANVEHIFHLEPNYHAALYSSSRFVLNVTRRDMVMAGHSPSVRLFEAAACGGTIISDNWPGLETFFTPGAEILIPASSEHVVRYLTELSVVEIRRIGDAARARVLAEHTSTHRAMEFESHVQSLRPSAQVA
jgi:spore maturation protein CgeB